MKIIVNKNISKKNFMIITIFAVLLGTTIICFGVKGFIKVNILKSHKRENAKITYSTYLDTSRYDEMHSTYKIKVRYVYFVDNKQYEKEEILWWTFTKSTKNAKVGDEIEIIYNANNPSQSEVYHISYVFIIIGICCIVISLILLRHRMKEE